jgi:hypothetical protein
LCAGAVAQAPRPLASCDDQDPTRLIVTALVMSSGSLTRFVQALACRHRRRPTTRCRLRCPYDLLSRFCKVCAAVGWLVECVKSSAHPDWWHTRQKKLLCAVRCGCVVLCCIYACMHERVRMCVRACVRACVCGVLVSAVHMCCVRRVCAVHASAEKVCVCGQRVHVSARRGQKGGCFLTRAVCTANVGQSKAWTTSAVRDALRCKRRRPRYTRQCRGAHERCCECIVTSPRQCVVKVLP